MKDRPPRVLSTVYKHGLQTLDNLLVDLISTAMLAGAEDVQIGVDGDRDGRDASSSHNSHQNECEPRSSRQVLYPELRLEARKRFIQDRDPAEYLDLLKNSYAVMSETAPTLGPVSFEQRWTQQQIVERVIVLQFRQEGKPSHVLCSGFRKLRPPTGTSNRLSAPQGFDCLCENSSVEIVNSNSWKILLSRVGDLIMLHLLSHSAIFTPLPNNCFLQISGVPARMSASMSRKFPSLHPGEKILGGLANNKRTPSALQKWSGSPSFAPVEGKKDQVREKGDKRSQSPKLFQTSRTNLASGRKRPRTDEAETRASLDIPEGCEGKLAKKIRRYGSSEHNYRKGGVLRPEMVDASNSCALVSGTGGLVEVNTSHSVVSIPNQCSKRHVATGCPLKYSSKLCVNDDKVLLHSMNLPKSPEMCDDDMSKLSDNYLPELNLNVVQLSVCSPTLENRPKLSIGHKRNSTSQGSVSIQTLNPVQVQKFGILDQCPSRTEVADSSRSRRRVRPPSWKRRKLRQALLSPVEQLCTNHPPVCDENQLGSAQHLDIADLLEIAEEQEEEFTKAVHDKSKTGLLELCHSQVSDSADLNRCQTDMERINERELTSREPLKAQRRETMNGRKPSTTSGRLIDRAPIFYNSNFACHPGLPAKHIFNTSKPNTTGVTHLFNSIFGAHLNIPVCSSSGNHVYAKYSRSKLKPGIRKHFTSINKLLKDLISNAKRCAFARLLHRHCPLPDGFQIPPVNLQNAISVPLLQSKTPMTEHRDSELVKDRHEDHQQDSGDEHQKLLYAAPGPEVEEIMRLWLGSNYEPSVQKTEPSVQKTETVLDSIVGSSSHKDVHSSRNMDQILTSHVDRNCKIKKRNDVVNSFVGHIGVTEKTSQSDLISCYTNHDKVVGFLWAVCRSIIPQDMLGSLRSWRALRSSIAQFVGLRRHEKFNVRHALIKLRVSRFSWLAFECGCEDSNIQEVLGGRFTIEDRDVKQKRLELWLYWLFTNLVVPTIRSHFYVTENENHRQNIFYYRKPVWARIRTKGLKELLSKNYKKLSTQAVAQVLKTRVLGFSQIRLMPKRTGLRPIANLAAASQGILKFNFPLKEGQATLPQGFQFSSNDPKLFFSKRLPHDLGRPICGDAEQCTSVEPDEKLFALDGNKDTSVVNFENTAAARSLSCTASVHERLDPYLIVKVPQIQKRCKKRVKFYFRSINSMLRDVHCCLKFEKEAHPDDLGSSVFGYCDIHAKILPFILHLKCSLNGMPRLFMAVCDVAKAYDTIQQEKLQEIMESFVQVSNYNVARYTCITPALASIRVSHQRACTVEDIPPDLVYSLRGLATKRSHCIFTDQALRTSVRRSQVIAVLGEHVKQNIVQIGAHFYQQTVGIPQGSVLSSLLCSLFYGHFDVHDLLPLLQSNSTESPSHFLDRKSSMSISEVDGNSAECDKTLMPSVSKASGSAENEVEHMLELSLAISDNKQDHWLASMSTAEFFLPLKSVLSHGLESNNLDHQDNQIPSATVSIGGRPSERDSMLLRLIDDSFFISTSETAVRTFVESMHRGSEEYGCHANEGKTAVNFDLQIGNGFLPRKVYISEDGACFMQWSGLLINCYTLEFQADYTRYCGEHIRSTLTVRREGHQGWQLVLKMCQYMRPKCHALFFDPRINSPATIRLNAFQAFLLCAMKFHAYVCCLPPVTGSNEQFLYKAIVCATRYMYGLLRHRMETVGASAATFFPFKELEWLALVAFHRVLKRKQARYQILLRMLETQMQMQKYNEVRASSHLSSATDERRSSMFNFIKY